MTPEATSIQLRWAVDVEHILPVQLKDDGHIYRLNDPSPADPSAETHHISPYYTRRPVSSNNPDGPLSTPASWTALGVRFSQVRSSRAFESSPQEHHQSSSSALTEESAVCRNLQESDPGCLRSGIFRGNIYAKQDLGLVVVCRWVQQRGSVHRCKQSSGFRSG